MSRSRHVPTDEEMRALREAGQFICRCPVPVQGCDGECCRCHRLIDTRKPS